jgi:hypothetical protein
MQQSDDAIIVHTPFSFTGAELLVVITHTSVLSHLGVRRDLQRGPAEER